MSSSEVFGKSIPKSTMIESINICHLKLDKKTKHTPGNSAGDLFWDGENVTLSKANK